MALTDTAVKNARHSGSAAGDKLSDGGGMFLLVKASGKYWRMDYRFADKRKTLALGVYPAVSLGQARKAREKARELLAQGIDPNLHRKAEKLQRAATLENSFQSVAMRWLDQWSIGKTPHTIDYTVKRLERDVFPIVGALPIGEVTAPMLIAIVKKVEERGALDMAARALSNCGQIFRYAVAHGITDSNPASFIKPSDVLPQRKAKHHARITAKDLPQLLRDMDDYQGSILTRIAMQLMALTFVRTGDLIGARWDEFDLVGKRWDIPAHRMKMDTPHIVPLARQALVLLRELHTITGRSEWLFPHESNPRKHMSNNTVLYALYRMCYKGTMTGHGFRGLASTILHEQGFDHAHIELQLAHSDRDEVSAAYNHATYLTQRGKLMQWWADYLQARRADNVIVLPKRKAG